jgi:CheY-like chemotaxis protein
VTKTRNTTAGESRLASAWLLAEESESGRKQPDIAPQNLDSDRGRKIVALLVEDNRTDVLMVEEAIELQGLPVELHIVDDGEEACDVFERVDNNPEAIKPDVLLLDLNLPKRTGRDVLACLRRSKTCQHIPALIITSSDTSKERAELAELGVAAYFRKPASYDEFMKLGSVFKWVLEEYKLQ